MIYDAENTFWWQESVSTGTESEYIKTGEGDAGNPLWLYVSAKNKTECTVELYTAEVEDNEYSDDEKLGTFTVPEGAALKAKVPAGDKGALKLKLTAGTDTLTAALVMDVDLGTTTKKSNGGTDVGPS